MLESFQIRNFRLFEHLQVERLNRVNLIVGHNNVGKSTFLEALELYISNASPDVLIDLLESRQETWFSEAHPQHTNLAGNSVRHLFFGHKMPQAEEQGILLGELSSSVELHLGAAAYQSKTDDEGGTRRIRVSGFQPDLFDEDPSNIEIFFVAEEGERTRRLFRLNRDLNDIESYSSWDPFDQKPKFKFVWQIVSTENVSDRKLATLWDLTSLTNLEKEVISALKLIDNRVSGVAFVEDMSYKGVVRNRIRRIPLVKVEGIDEPLTLKSMGDGMTRLFHMIVALVNAQNGLLLIDEFENGLHWSVQPKVWDILFQLSEKLNVQVFATTHSRDCIKGFENAWNHYPALGAFFRLDRRNGRISAIEYTAETLADAIEMDVEVR